LKSLFKVGSKAKGEALAKIREELRNERRQPDEIPKQHVTDFLGINNKAAEYRLDKLIKEKKMASRLLKPNLKLNRWVK